MSHQWLVASSLVTVLGGCYASAGLGYGSERTMSVQATAGLSLSLERGQRIHASAGVAMSGPVADKDGMLPSEGEDTKVPGLLVVGVSLPVWRSLAIDLDVQPPIGGSLRPFGADTGFDASVGRYYLGVGQRWRTASHRTTLAYSFGPEVFAHTDSRSSDRASLLVAGKVAVVFSPRMVLQALGDCLENCK